MALAGVRVREVVMLTGVLKMHLARKRPRVLPLVMRAEISYDLVMGDDMAFIEGTYRIACGDWRVVIVSRCDVAEPEVMPQTWDSGVSGVFVRFPRASRLNREAIERVLSGVLGVSEWVQVRGPDSMELR